MKTIFLPAIYFLDRLRYSLKFALVMVLTLAVAVALFIQVFVQFNHEIRTTEAEIAGLKLFDSGFVVVLLTQQHRGLSAGVLGGSQELVPVREAKGEELQRALGMLDEMLASESAWADLIPRWQAVRSELQALAEGATRLSGPESFRRHTSTIANLLNWLAEVGDATGLALDADAATANLIQPLLTSLPALSERLGQLRARGTNIIARQQLQRSDERDVVALLAEVAYAQDQLSNNLQRAGRAESSLAGIISELEQSIVDAVAKVRTAAEEEVLSASFRLAPSAYFDLVTRSIDSIVARFNEVLRPHTGRLLEERLADRRFQLGLQISLSLLAMGGAAYLFIAIYLAILRSVNELSAGAQRFASGDYRQRIVFSARDELAEVAHHFNVMADELATLIAQIQHGASALGQSAGELTVAAGNVSTGSEAQNEAASAVAVAVEEMTVSVEEINRHAGMAQTLAETSGKLSEEGGQIMQRSVAEMERIAGSAEASRAAMEALGEQSRHITAIVDSIREIADQTNLLALNAAIEAARAGESGRGFAVVADEVRKLAERTATATQEIGGMVGSIQQGTAHAVLSMEEGVARVREGVQLSTQAGEAMAQINTGAGQVLAAVKEISLAINEQTLASSEIAQSVERIAMMAGDNNLAAGSSLRTAHELEELASGLQGQISRFQV
ncbi:MAG: methyl-accepting chemotaxis protein [Thauera sp.]|nr:methyl-accepting chemotaxis protein [Thauera sp.]